MVGKMYLRGNHWAVGKRNLFLLFVPLFLHQSVLTYSSFFCNVLFLLLFPFSSVLSFILQALHVQDVIVLPLFINTLI